MKLRLVLVLIILIFPISIFGQGQNPFDEQYKRITRDAIADIYDGNVNNAIERLELYLDVNPNDLESLYGLAVAYSVKNDIQKSINYMAEAIEKGLPPERFIAGPRSQLNNLTNTREFRQFMEGKYKGLIHGPMMGNIASDHASIWVRTSGEASVKIDIASVLKPGLKQSFYGNSVTDSDYTSIIKLTGLESFIEYIYDVYVDGNLLYENGSFTTYPKENETANIRIGFGGGAGYTPWHERMWDTLATRSLDAFLLLGDNVYIDHPTRPPVQEYCYYRRQSRPEFHRFVSSVPVYAIWDDHDFTIDDGEGGPDIDYPEWKRLVWNTFKNNWNNPYYGGGEEHPGCWFDFSIADVDFIMLDCRYYRENPQTVEQPSMLGYFQKQWLKDRLLSSKGTFKVIGSSVPWATGTKPGSDDTWDGFPDEREEIFSFIEENQIEGVVLISADRHRSDAWKIDRPNGYTMYDFMSSRLTNIHTHEILPGSLFGYNKTCTFGTLDFNTNLEDPKVVYSIFSINNELIHQLTLYKSQLTPKK
ncbi:alkaline phosphatase D family protein [Bacteroidota bacterium]